MNNKLYVVSVEHLRKPFIYFIVWFEIRNLGISRQKMLEKLSLLQANFVREDVTVLLPNGEPFEILEIDEIISDPEFRWYSNYIKQKPLGLFPFYHCKRYDIIQWFHLYLQWNRSDTTDLFKNYLKL